MRGALDPSVLVSALLSRRGTPGELIRLWSDGAFELVVSPLLLAELERVLAYPRIRSRVSRTEAEEFVALLNEAGLTVDDPDQPPSLRSADPHDDCLLALAGAARALIVSGDKHLLDMAERLPVYSPADFRRLLRARES